MDGIKKEDLKQDSWEPEDLITQRKERVASFLKSRQIWIIGVLIVAVIFGVYMRVQPMLDHGGNPGLWDITTDNWTLGPDLDPWLFERYAKIIVETGTLPKMDYVRNVPLGFETARETKFLAYLIAYTHKAINIFTPASIEFSAALFPVIMFALTIVSFFLFVREIFIRDRKDFMKANLISTISTFFLIVIPAFLSRTVAGIPEKESAAFFFLFLALYFFLKSWKADKTVNSLILSVLSGISTGLMGLVWGGVVYAFVTIATATFFSFIFGNVKKREIGIYILWISAALFIMTFLSNKYSISALVGSIKYVIIFMTLLTLVVHYILWYTPVSKNKLLNLKLPKCIISLILAIVLGVIAGSIIFGPGFIFKNVDGIINTFINPTTGRWGVTVAENRQPYFEEWGSSFGPFIKGFPVMFWMFFLGSVLLFRELVSPLRKKESWVLTGLYIIFFLGLVFSRYAPHPSTFDGENFISKLFYFGSAFLLVAVLFYYYMRYYKENNKSFKKIDFSLLLLFSLFVLCLVTTRSAIRLIMVLASVAPILVGYLIVRTITLFRGSKDETFRIILGALMVVVILLSLFTFVNFYQNTKAQSYNFIPSYYNQQWQKAMSWVRDNTSEDAVFAHWWDYGYWVQSIGNRATVVDGGNMITYWNYLMGRIVLTGDNQDDALEFLYNHNTTHFLIDPTDIGKYGAFSSIGSNENYDRYSWFGTFLLNEENVKETQNKTILFYEGGIALDEDLIIKENGQEILIPGKKAGVGAVIIPSSKGNNTNNFEQPYVIVIYNGKQYNVNVRYMYIQGSLIDFKEGEEAVIYLIPKLESDGSRVGTNPIGAAMFITPRLTRGMFSQLYLMNDTLGNFPNFRLVHTESNLIVESLRSQGLDLPEFIYYQGIQGPIKIWEIEYTGREQIKEEYLDIDSTKYLNWTL